MISGSESELIGKNWVNESPLYETMTSRRVRCGVCERRCVINRSGTGFCRTKMNIEGRLYALTYGDISVVSENPIEKKPFFHFWPGSVALTVGSYGCNLVCPWCQNWDISKSSPNVFKANYVSPESLIEIIERSRCNGTSFSFNEPSTSLFEYSLDVMKIAKEKGLYNTYVTNLYSTLEALRLIVESGCDAFCVNVKGGAKAVAKYCGVDVEIVWRNLKELANCGKHIEIVTLVVPTVNDDESSLRSIASRIKNELGAKVPWHCTRYYAAYKALERGLPKSTPVSTLEKARSIGLDEGLKYVYLGNVPGHPGENTYCTTCRSLLIERIGLASKYLDIDRTDNSCRNCRTKLDVIGKCL